MGGLKDSLTNWMFPNPDGRDSSMSAEDGRHAPREDQGQPTRSPARELLEIAS